MNHAVLLKKISLMEIEAIGFSPLNYGIITIQKESFHAISPS